MGDEKLNAVLKWASQLATLQDNLGDRFDLVENKRGRFDLVPRQMIDNEVQRRYATLAEASNALNNNTEILYPPRQTAELRRLEAGVEDQLSKSAITKLATRGMRRAADLPLEDRVAAAQIQAGYLGTGRDVLTGGPMSMLNYDGGHIRSYKQYPEVASDPLNIRPQPSSVNRAAKDLEGSALAKRLVDSYVRMVRR